MKISVKKTKNCIVLLDYYRRDVPEILLSLNPNLYYEHIDYWGLYFNNRYKTAELLRILLRKQL